MEARPISGREPSGEAGGSTKKKETKEPHLEGEESSGDKYVDRVHILQLEVRQSRDVYNSLREAHRKMHKDLQTLRDRLAAAEGILEASRESFASSKEKSTAARAFSKSQRDVDSDTARRNAIESVVDNASRRFAHDASAFVASFPDKWSPPVSTP